jgi:hypothetical protein
MTELKPLEPKAAAFKVEWTTDADEFLAILSEIDEEMYEQKRKFIAGLNLLLITTDPTEYAYLAADPMRYEVECGRERVWYDKRWHNVTGDSLTAMLGDIFRD